MEASSRAAYVSAIEEWRAQRDLFFKSHYASPLEERDQEAFDGLTYFDIDPALVFAVDLEPATEERMDILSSRGASSPYRKAGEIGIPFGEGTKTLIVLSGEDNDMFIPFRDATNGDGTYEAGRYVGVERHPDGNLVVDFNKATNPYCAYDPEFSCPLPPPQNTCGFRIEAGEMAFP